MAVSRPATCSARVRSSRACSAESGITVTMPELADFADQRFLENHCFDFGGERRHRRRHASANRISCPRRSCIRLTSAARSFSIRRPISSADELVARESHEAAARADQRAVDRRDVQGAVRRAFRSSTLSRRWCSLATTRRGRRVGAGDGRPESARGSVSQRAPVAGTSAVHGTGSHGRGVQQTCDLSTSTQTRAAITSSAKRSISSSCGLHCSSSRSTPASANCADALGHLLRRADESGAQPAIRHRVVLQAHLLLELRVARSSPGSSRSPASRRRRW